MSGDFHAPNGPFIYMNNTVSKARRCGEKLHDHISSRMFSQLYKQSLRVVDDALSLNVLRLEIL